jgi:hypothetical protein
VADSEPHPVLFGQKPVTGAISPFHEFVGGFDIGKRTHEHPDLLL